METLLVKIFATALALSQVTTTPDAVKTAFSRDRDQHQVAQLLEAGCTHMMQAFDIENFNLDDLIATAMDDPQAIGGENNAFRGINFADLRTAYRQFCKNEEVETRIDLGDVVDFYNKAVANLPDHNRLKGLKLPGTSIVLDGKGERFAEVFEENQRPPMGPARNIPDQYDENDAWFMGFTNDVTVAIWLGYDNADGKRRTLGGGSTGGGVAVPIFEPVIRRCGPMSRLKRGSPRSPEAKRQLACKSTDLESGEPQERRRTAATECFRLSARGQILDDTQYRLISRESNDQDRERVASRMWLEFSGAVSGTMKLPDQAATSTS